MFGTQASCFCIQYRLDFDNVKPDAEVAMKTGFRRLLYQRQRAPVSKETKEERRMDRLRYPWDYTNDNVYHLKPSARKGKKDKEKKKRKPKIWEVEKPAEPEDPYPQHDPFGLYRPRPTRERKPIEESKAEKDVKKMLFSEVLVKARAKAALAKTERDPADEDDIMFERFINRPLPKSDVASYVPATGNLYDFTASYHDDEKLNPELSKKIEDSRFELKQFENMLDNKFSKKHRLMNPVAPPLVRGALRSSTLYPAAGIVKVPLAREECEEDEFEVKRL